MSEEPVVETPQDDAAIEAEAASLVADPAEEKADKVKNALITAKKALRDANRRVKELEPIAARSKEIEEKLEAASPIIAAVQTNPKLMAEAIRVVKGTAATSTRVEQPTEDDDPEAAEIAETLGLFLSDGTADLVRARKTLNVLDKRHGRQTNDIMRPFAGAVLGSRAEQNIAHVVNQTRDDGAPLATKESIQEAIALLGGPQSRLLADPGVADVLITMAVGLDGRKGRTPKAPDEPVYMERQGGGRRVSAPVIDDTLKAALERTGIKADDAAKSIGRLDHIGRKGVELGGS